MDKCVKMMANNAISIRVPMRIRKYGGKKMIILPEGYQMMPPKEARNTRNGLGQSLLLAKPA